MTKSKFFTILFAISIIFVFIKIYQHNQVVKLSYEKQRLENKTINLKKKKDQLLIELYTLKDPQKVKQIAQEKFGMQPLKLSQILTLTSKEILNPQE